MAHGRIGPDIVMTTRYAGASEIRAVTDHELNRTADGSSAIDPDRTPLNEILHGPRTQQEAVQKMWSDGVRPPTKQSEEPFVQMVLSASPEYFRGESQGPGEWNPEKLKVWKSQTIDWLKDEYGADLAHVSLHLDEDTPHMHVLIVPTYERKSRKPSRRKKGGETLEDFAKRLAEWEADGGSTRTAGRSSSPYWSRMWCRLEARKSYHRAMENLGLGYGHDFVGLDEDSPVRKATGKWVREQAALLAEREIALDKREAEIEVKAAALDDRQAHLDAREKAQDEKADEIGAAEVIVQHDQRRNAAMRQELDRKSADLDLRESSLDENVALFKRLTRAIADRLGVKVANGVRQTLDRIAAALAPPPEPEMSVLDQMDAAAKRSARAEQASPEADGLDGPGL